MTPTQIEAAAADDNPKRIVDVQPATSSTPRRYIYADGTVVEIHYGPRQTQTWNQNNQWQWPK